MTFGGWAFFVLATLLIFNVLSIEFYFMLCPIGFLVIAQMSGPFISRPKWRSRINLIMVVSVFTFLLIVIGKVLDILQIRLF
jgi:hypothetical protein